MYVLQLRGPAEALVDSPTGEGALRCLQPLSSQLPPDFRSSRLSSRPHRTETSHPYTALSEFLSCRIPESNGRAAVLHHEVGGGLAACLMKSSLWQSRYRQSGTADRSKGSRPGSATWGDHGRSFHLPSLLSISINTTLIVVTVLRTGLS